MFRKLSFEWGASGESMTASEGTRIPHSSRARTNMAAHANLQELFPLVNLSTGRHCVGMSFNASFWYLRRGHLLEESNAVRKEEKLRTWGGGLQGNLVWWWCFTFSSQETTCCQSTYQTGRSDQSESGVNSQRKQAHHTNLLLLLNYFD